MSVSVMDKTWDNPIEILEPYPYTRRCRGREDLAYHIRKEILGFEKIRDEGKANPYTTYTCEILESEKIRDEGL